MHGESGKEVAIAESIARHERIRNIVLGSLLDWTTELGEMIFGEILGESIGEHILGECFWLFALASLLLSPISLISVDSMLRRVTNF
jgi:hypothetical protein